MPENGTLSRVSHLDFGSVLFIAIGLSADCFAVALSAGASAKILSRFQVFRTSVAFGAFQALMPLLGWLAGNTFVDLISDYDHWVAFGLLAFIGSRMIWESLRHQGAEPLRRDFSRGFILITLAVATSIDALAVGLSFAFLEVNIVLAVVTIGGVAFAVTALGFVVGRRVGQRLGRRAETAGGLILIAIGIRILLSHLL